MTTLFKENETILFQGDSITDTGRNRENGSDLGRGYALMTSALLGARHPELRLRCLNRGISGNRVKDLRARWDADCIDIKPDWVSILIGINDTWRRYDRNDPTTVEAYEEDYRFILDRIVKETDARIVICEPFLLPHPEDRVAWREDLNPKLEAARKLAREFHAVLVPLDTMFAKLTETPAPEYWAADGVHPTPAGHARIAEAWIDAVEASE